MNPDGTVSESLDEPQCSSDGCTNSVIPGTGYCDVHSTSKPDGGGKNGGADGTMSDGTNATNDINGGWQDGTLRKASMTPEEIRLAAYLSEVRAKYSEERLAELGHEGHAIKNIDGSYSFPVEDREDVESIIHAIAKSDEAMDPVRSFVLSRAADLELMDIVPELWKSALSPEAREVADAAEAEAAAEAPVEEPEVEAEEAETEETEVDEEARAERKERKPRHRSSPTPREEIRDSIVHFGINDLKVTEVRSSTGAVGQITLEGTPIVYNRSYAVHDMWGTFQETMSSTVCDAVLSSPLRLDCRFLINHDGIPLARTQSGTLELENTREGLRSIVSLDTRQTLASDLAIAIERGDVSQMSCGFIVGDDQWNDDMTTRTINSLSELLDVSAVTYPASPTTHIEVAQRMMNALPVESRSRLREAYKVMNEIRAGRKFNTQNAQLILSALESLHEADDLDPAEFASRAASIAAAHQSASDALNSLDGLELEPAADNGDEANGGGDSVVDPGEGIRSDDEAATLRRQQVLARREQLARKRYLG